jgi:hypothetical protein
VRDGIVVRDIRAEGLVRKVLAATARGAAVMPSVATMVDVLRSAAQRYLPEAA